VDRTARRGGKRATEEVEKAKGVVLARHDCGLAVSVASQIKIT